MASEMHIILERGLRIREEAADRLNSAGMDLSVRINPDLIVPDPSEQDRTDGLTDNERRDEDRRDAA